MLDVKGAKLPFQILSHNEPTKTAQNPMYATPKHGPFHSLQRMHEPLQHRQNAISCTHIIAMFVDLGNGTPDNPIENSNKATGMKLWDIESIPRRIENVLEESSSVLREIMRRPRCAQEIPD